MKKKLLLTSILSIVMCFSIIAGATFALFTSESTINAVVSSGTVSVTATASDLEVYSRDQIQAGNTFENSGTATLTENKVVIDRMTPMDEVRFNVTVNNYSDVIYKYQTKLAVVGASDLLPALTIEIYTYAEDGTLDMSTKKVFDGLNGYSDWITGTPADSDPTTADLLTKFQIRIIFADHGAWDNDYKGKGIEFAYTVNAIQGNAETPSLNGIDVPIYTVEDLKLFANSVNAGNKFNGKTVALMNNIDLEDQAWTPISNTATSDFRGTFDGQGKTISNLNVSGDAYVGLFGYIGRNSENPTTVVKNLNIENTTVNAVESAGALAGKFYTGTIENVTVKGDIAVSGNYKLGGVVGEGYVKMNGVNVIGNNGSFVEATYLETDLEGDNIGGIIGHTGEGSITVKGSVKNIAVSGSRKVGGAIGYCNYSRTTDVTVDNVVVSTNASEEYILDNLSKIYVGGIVGEYGKKGTETVTINGSISNSTVNGFAGNYTDAIVGGSRNSGTEATVNATATNVTINTLLDSFIIGAEGDVRSAGVSNAEGLMFYNALVQKGFVNEGLEVGGKTLYINDDINMNGYVWAPMNIRHFNIEGNGKTISNLTAAESWRSGLMGYHGGGSIKNLNLVNVTATGAQVGALAGALEGVAVENCSLENATINYKAYSSASYTETWGGIGALTGVVPGEGKKASLNNVTIKGDIVLNYNGMETECGSDNYVKQLGFLQHRDVTNLTDTANYVINLVDGLAYDEVTNTYTISKAAGLAAAGKKYFAKGGTFNFAADIDMTGVEYAISAVGAWSPTRLTVNGNNKTISNLVVENQKQATLFGDVNKFDIVGLNVKDSIFKGINNMDGEYSAAAFVGFSEAHSGETNTIKNCTLTNVTISDAKYAGGFVAYASGSGNLVVDSCKLIDSTIKSEYTEDGVKFKGHAGGIIGYAQTGTVSNCRVEGLTMIVEGARGGVIIGSPNDSSVTIGDGNVVVNDTTVNGNVVTEDDMFGEADKRADKTNYITIVNA